MPVACAVLALAGGAALAQPDGRQGFYYGAAQPRPAQPDWSWVVAHGARIYDLWWSELPVDPPSGTHPAYPAGGSLEGPETWRCVSCHGWDYKGMPEIGTPGIDGATGGDTTAIAELLRGPGHGYTAEMIDDDALEAVALFVSEGQVDVAARIDPDSREIAGDRVRGRRIFQGLCAVCHDYDGTAWITGEGDGLETMGAVAAAKPARAVHRVMNGLSYADMPAMRVFDLDTVLDILSYVQTLPATPGDEVPVEN